VGRRGALAAAVALAAVGAAVLSRLLSPAPPAPAPGLAGAPVSPQRLGRPELDRDRTPEPARQRQIHAPQPVATTQREAAPGRERCLVLGSVGGAVPQADLRVEACASADGQTVSAPVAAATFELPLPCPGEYWLRAVQRGAASPWLRARVTGPARIDLVLRSTVTVSGSVQATLDAPATLELRDPVGRTARATTLPDGSFELPAVAGEAYTLVARAPGRATAVRELFAPDRVDLSLEPLVEVAAQPFVGHDGQPVRGRLWIDPAPRDRHAHPDPQLASEVALDAGGVPQLEGLPAGRWLVSFLEPAPDELRAWVLELDTDAPASLAFDGRGARGQVTGRVLARLPEDELVQVELRPAGSGGDAFRFLAARAADAAGGFRFGAVPPGTYTLRADWGSGVATGEPFVVVAGRPSWVEVSE
jgi:hypothetical protein